ncbi:Tetratricopeptide repeat protein 27, partial [Stegodyphus mimosarum]
MRCSAEKDNSRRVERAIMQMETIVDSIKKDSPPFSVRQFMLYATAFPMYWILEKELADLLLSVGATKSALEIYERLQLWEDIIVCYQRLGRTMCAEKVIQEQLAEKETPLLWCLLGDVTDNPEHYSKAWELSEHRSTRSQRSLAYYYFKRKDYEKSIPFFLSSLEINHLQPDVWFSLGYTATQLEKYELAAQAYRQVVSLDQDNFEAWNNLSNAYIKTKQKVRAWRSLQEALKCNYEEWRVWENFLLVSIDVGAFEDVLRAWHRLLDIKGKHQDSEILEILVNAIRNDLPDINGCPASRLKKRALQLFGRLTSLITTDSKVWELYSLLLCANESFISDKDTLERIVQFQQKAFRCCIQKGQWEKEFSMCKEVSRIALRLAEVSVLYVKILEGNLKNQQKVSLKLALQNVICRIEKSVDNFQVSEKEELKLSLTSMKNYLLDIETL